jgi:oxygen-independent coproporphyrinogen-3 oxidase
LLKNNKEIALYVHWPYCLKKCPYCDFNSHVTRQPIDINEWEIAYKNEIEAEQNILGEKNCKEYIFWRRHSKLNASKIA